MTGGVMSQKFVVGAGLLVCSVCSLSAMAGSKPVDLILRVLVDAPPPCSIKGSQVEFGGNDSNLLIVFYVQIMPDDFVMQLHRF